MKNIWGDTYGHHGSTRGTGDAAGATEAAGFSKGDADVLRKDRVRKQEIHFGQMKSPGHQGAGARGLDATVFGKRIWRMGSLCPNTPFNKSTLLFCLGWARYQTAYLKAHYPSEYYGGGADHAGSIEKDHLLYGRVQTDG